MAEIEAEAQHFDWSRVKAVTDQEIEAAAIADPDTYLATEEELQAALRERAERRKAKEPAAE